MLKNRKDIAEQILESKLDVEKYLKGSPTNLPLLRALHSNELLDVRTIFTDLDASVGETTITQALSLRPSGVCDVGVFEREWTVVLLTVKKLEDIIGNILAVPLETTAENYKIAKERSEQPDNVKLRITINNNIKELCAWLQSITTDLTGYNVSITTIIRDGVLLNGEDQFLIDSIFELSGEIEDGASNIKLKSCKAIPDEELRNTVTSICSEFEDFHEMLARVHNEISNIETGLETNISPSLLLFRVVIKEINKRLNIVVKDSLDFQKKYKHLQSSSAAFIQPPCYELKFNTDLLHAGLEQKYKSLMLRFKSSQTACNRDYSKQLLIDTHNYLSSINSFMSIPSLAKILQVDHKGQVVHDKLSACILGLLNSGVDVLVTGGAGSGKSTTLEMFARKNYEELNSHEVIVFLPLAKIIGPVDSEIGEETLSYFFEEISRLLRQDQPGVTATVVQTEFTNSENLVLVLDGIDEAVNQISWYIKIIHELKTLKGDRVQVVASSRFPVAQLEEAGLFRIELLPFRPEQVIRFVSDYLKNEPRLAADVVAHLKEHPAMFSVVTTPLMSTILCVLAQNGVNLPETKNSLYKERFELLSGAYDAKKQIHRVQSSKSCLEDVSKKAAYYLHSQRVRSENYNDVLAYVLNGLIRKYHTDVIVRALDELINPCNVLVLEIDGTIGFGHLSYQEYLVAEELYSNRSSEIGLHLSDPWWREVLVLIAMKSDDIGEIIEKQILKEGVIGAAGDTLKAMINVCQPNQRRALSQLLKNHKSLDYM